jgi:hypothetical protein
MIVGWGKPVKISSTPVVLSSSHGKGFSSAPLPPPPVPVVAKPRAPSGLPSSLTNISSLSAGAFIHTVTQELAGSAHPAPSASAPVPVSMAAPAPAPLPAQPPAALRPAAEPASKRNWDIRTEPIAEAEMQPHDARIRVHIPTDSRTRDRIDLMARFVAIDGEAFEKVQCLHPAVCVVQ